MKKITLTDDQWKALTQIYRGQNHFKEAIQFIDELTSMGLVSESKITEDGIEILRQKGLFKQATSPVAVGFGPW